MRGKMKARGWASPAHVVFAVTMIALGILGLIKRDFAPIWQPVPKGLPGREVLIYLCALVSLGCGLGLLWRRTAAVASRLLWLYLLGWLLLLRVPYIFVSPTIDMTWAASEVAAIVAAAWVLYVRCAGDRDEKRLGLAAGDTGLRIARTLFGLALIPFGVAHFMYLDNTAPLVPGWLPWHVAWAYFTGGAFIVAGVAIVVGVWARLAATLAALEIALFTLLVWVPIVARGAANAFQWHEFIASCALTAVAWVVADSYRDQPWLGERAQARAPERVSA